MTISAGDRSHPGSGANLSNWRAEPYNRWAFHNARELVPVAEIANAPDDVLALPEAPDRLERFALSLPGGTTLGLDAVLAATATDGIVVLHDGRVVCERYANGTTAQTPHVLMSATKSFVGLLAGILERRGDLETGALVSRYLPAMARTAYRDVRVRDLLDMRSGVVLDERDLHDYEVASNWDPFPADEAATTYRTFFEASTTTPQPPGGPFAYVSANTDLLGLVIERATGRRFADLASDSLWKPLGAERGAYVTLDREGSARTTGGLCATVRDFARLGELVVRDGRRGARDVVPPDWIADIATNGDRAAWRDGEFGAGFSAISTAMYYRSGWYAIDEEPQLLFAMGVHGQHLFVDRTNRIVIAKVSSQSTRVDFRAIGLTHLAVPEIRRCVLAG